MSFVVGAVLTAFSLPLSQKSAIRCMRCMLKTFTTVRGRRITAWNSRKRKWVSREDTLREGTEDERQQECTVIWCRFVECSDVVK